MKNFLLFGYNRFYPEGGFNDFIDDFNTLQGAKDYITEHIKNDDRCDYYQIMDLRKKTLIKDVKER